MHNYRFTLNINQYGAVEYNKRNQGKEIDLLDVILLTEIKCLTEWPNIEKRNIRGKEFAWIAYSKIIDELPLLGITTTDAIGRRLKNLCGFGLMEKETLQTGKENRKTYFHITSKGMEIVTLRMGNRNPYGWETVTPTDGKPYNKNTINKNTKDERELTPFEFLKKHWKKDFEIFMRNYGNKIKDLKKFELDFNDWCIIKNIDLKKN